VIFSDPPVLRFLPALILAANAWGAPVTAPTSIADLRRLTLDEARLGRECVLEGVATALETPNQIRTVQDESGAIFLNLSGQDQPVCALGDRVRIFGRTEPGGFAPIFRAEKIERLGPGILPEPVRAEAQELQSGALDCRWVEVEGVVRAQGRAWESDGPALLTLASGGSRLPVIYWDRVPPPDLRDAVVRVRGICTSWFNEKRQIIGSHLRVTDAAVQVHVLTPPRRAEEVPVCAIAGLLQYDATTDWRRRVRLRGTVIAKHRGEWVQLQDEARGLRVWLAELVDVPLGKEVEVLGFAERGAYGPHLADATLRVEGAGLHGSADVFDPEKYAALDGRLVRTKAELMEIRHGAAETSLLLRTSGFTFPALLPAAAPAAWRDFQPAALLELTGVCIVAMGSERLHGSFPKPVGCELRLRLPSDVRVLAAAPWWTPSRTFRALAVVLAISGVGVAWTLTVVRKNRALHAAESELRGARDLLEQRVVVRTGQLQEQLAARQLEQAEFAAVNAERTRLARELHDSVEQALAGAAWQFEAVSRTFASAPEKAAALLDRAVILLRRAQDEVRRTVWGLRALALERSDLPEALRENLALLTDGSGIHTDLIVGGVRRALPAAIETGLLRLAQEAIANALKHAAPQHLLVRLDYAPETISLRVQDDGRGFRVSEAVSLNGHFGLRDLHERASGLGGQVALESEPGVGTTVAVRLPIRER
jgi:signal transduction histidine kinase